ncbi:TIGR03084 family metal-binding protein [Solicola gregarius]|uniref:TIGR03084 family metal-binding protein n=1 Tax=Solicola gregarius TaxID=2908642 RepID=A0AA46YN21_9ACTN|nr:TIGR03084 family metal-binding protein [Solicola gregarius]UYM07169.1 TIGR03084 family metal-binding protein [Solicola gregarius]
MSDRLAEVLGDLDAEGAQLDSWVCDLPADSWPTPTPAPGWTVAHQIAHLHWTDEASLKAIAGDDFADVLQAAAANPTGYVHTGAEALAAIAPAELLVRWREGRARLSGALRDVPKGERIAWFGPPMSPASMATARLMETWAHAHDVAGALGLEVPVTSRVRHVCHLGVRTRGFAYAVRGLQVPDTEVYVELTGPEGETWTWGSTEAPERVTGSAWDFGLLVTRRRHLDDVDVHADGSDAEQWLTIAQAFAGPPGRDPVRLSEREPA